MILHRAIATLLRLCCRALGKRYVVLRERENR
jgi:hypothetical protein